MNKINLMQGDCLERMSKIPDNSIDAIVTDPPYGLSFMGKKWDYDVPSVEIWQECLRVLKPGGHLLAFAGTRTQHRMAVRIEDAGFEIRDMIAWVYGSGFPKSLDVSKAIDKAAGAEREVVGREANWGASRAEQGKAAYGDYAGGWNITAPATEAAKQWQGWGTALKPALEPITVARKPLIGTVAENVLEYGTGAINIDGCRVGRADGDESGWSKTGSKASKNRAMSGANYNREAKPDNFTGRWPANLIHDGSEEVVGLFPQTTSGNPSGKRNAKTGFSSGITAGVYDLTGYGDTGSAARFFYCAKASKRDRDEGLEDWTDAARRMFASSGRTMKDGEWVETNSEPQARKNSHPTVKPTDLMRYLCLLVTPSNGTVLDPFMGSGSTGKAAMLEGFQFVGIERDPDYFKIAEARINNAKAEKLLI